MATRQRRAQRPSETETLDDEFSDVTEADIEAYLAEQDVEAEEDEKPSGFLNLQTGAGIGLIGLGTLYTLQQIGILPLAGDLSGLITLLPWLAGILIILTGLGVLSWSPASRRRRKARARAARIRRQKTMGRRRKRQPDEAGRRARRAFDTAEKQMSRAKKKVEDATRASRRSASRTKARAGDRRRFMRSQKDRKVLGVASGIAHYFGLEPTVVRVAFILATIFGWPIGIVLYVVLGAVMGKPDPDEDDPKDPLIRVVSD